MWIKQLELNNFQKHEHLLLNFTEGVNTIVGATDSGKSTIVRAIRWVFYPSELRGDVVRMNGSKKTSVKIILDNNIIIERIKTSSVNSYELTILEHKKETYNATGNTLPEDIQKIIKFIPIEIDNDKIILNIANQISMPFLLEKSGTFRQKLFNKLTGNDILDQAMQGLNKDILQIGREEKFTQSSLEELSQSLITIEKQEQDTEKLTKLFTKQVQEIKVLNEKLISLKECQQSLIKVDNQLFETKKKINSIKLIPQEVIKSIKQNIIKFDNYITLIKEMRRINSELKIAKEKLLQIKVPEIDIKSLIKKSEKLDQLIKYKENLTRVNNNLQSLIPKCENCKQTIKEKEKEYIDLLKSLKICPTCKQEIK
jgi:DNA repair exonuclease SbcCD ATPase subunit